MKALEKKLGMFGSKPGLKRIKKILKKWGNPQDKLRVILVTGTNGKGSVTSYLSSILQAAGKKVGSFYSPHLVKYNERIRINNKMISDRRFKKYEKEVLEFFKNGNEITIFEAITAIAYRHFHEQKVDFAVVEIGMGGTLDATNVVDAEMGIITNVDLEHTQYLGGSIEEIAADKAGILKKGICITGTKEEALEEVKRVAKENSIKVRAIQKDFFVEVKECNAKGNTFNYMGRQFYNGLKTSLLGRHQVDNAALAVAAAEEYEIEEEAIRKGLESAENLGRMHILEEKPFVVADAAHNPAALGTVLSTIEELFDYKKLIIVFGVRKTKDWKSMLELIENHADSIVVTKTKDDKNAEDPKKIAKITSAYMETKVSSDVKKALVCAKKSARKKDLVLVCGSIYMLGELLDNR